MTRSARIHEVVCIMVEAAGIFLGLAAILSLLWATPARGSDDHGMKEVEAAFGSPDSFEHTTCGGVANQYGETTKAWRCTIWLMPRDKDGDRLTLIFDRKTGNLATVGYLYASGRTSTPAGVERATQLAHELLHQVRGTPVKPSGVGL